MMGCNCYVRRHGRPAVEPITTAMTVEEARAAKWAEGQRKYGPVFVGDPLDELYAEMIDALNYCDELARRGRLSGDLKGVRWALGRIAEVVRAEGSRDHP